MMATNRMILDLNNSNDLIASLPLNSLGEISTVDMCRAMACEVGNVL